MSSILQTMRSAAATTKTLTSSMRGLSLAAARPATATALPAIQTRCLSQAVLSNARTTALGAAAPAVQTGVAVFQKVQTRGMKVRSSIKKRCEHCKVRQTDRSTLERLALGGSRS
jgi:large subunit ribosomal protein L36